MTFERSIYRQRGCAHLNDSSLRQYQLLVGYVVSGDVRTFALE